MARSWPWAVLFLFAAALAAAQPARASALPVQPVSIERVTPVASGVQVVHGYRIQAANGALYRNASVTIGRSTLGSVARARLFSPYGAAMSAVILGAGLLIDYATQEIYRSSPAMPPATGRYRAAVYNVRSCPSSIPDHCARLVGLVGVQVGSDRANDVDDMLVSAINVRGREIFGSDWRGAGFWNFPGWGSTGVFDVKLGGYAATVGTVWWDTAAGTSPVPWPNPPTVRQPLTDDEVGVAIHPHLRPSDFRDLLTDPVTGRPVHVPEMSPVMDDIAADAAAQTDADPANDPPPERQAEEQPIGCAIFPPFCDFVEWFKSDDGAPDTPDLPVEQVPEPQGWSAPIPADAACPAPEQFTITFPGGYTHTIPYRYDPICEAVSMMRPIVLAFAYLSAAFIMLGIPYKGGSDD